MHTFIGALLIIGCVALLVLAEIIPVITTRNNK